MQLGICISLCGEGDVDGGDEGDMDGGCEAWESGLSFSYAHVAVALLRGVAEPLGDAIHRQLVTSHEVNGIFHPPYPRGGHGEHELV